MQLYEYKVIPAPKKGEKSRNGKPTPDRFAATWRLVMNDLGREGWEYLRADTLPCEERVGFTGKTTTFQNMLVFRRPMKEAAIAPFSISPTPQTEPPAPRLGAAEPVPGPAPAIGSALAAE